MQFWDPRRILAGSSMAEDGPALILQGHQNSVISVAYSPAALLFATGSGKSVISPSSSSSSSPPAAFPAPSELSALFASAVAAFASSYLCLMRII